MNRSNMKSSISFQPEGRFIPRRKVATKSHLLNGVGDFDMELSLAIQESLKYAQQKDKNRTMEVDGCQEDGMKDSDDEKQDDSVVTCRSDQTRSNCHTNKSTKINAVTAGSEEVGRLKDLLLSQLELIQFQQEELNKKDREIKSLHSAKDTLQCRLERMERRLSIMKQREELHERHNVLLQSSKTSVQAAPTLASKSINEVSKVDLKDKRRRGQSSHISQRKRHRKSFHDRHSASTTHKNDLKEVSDSDNEENDDTSEGSDSAGDAESGSESDSSEKQEKGNHFENRSNSPDSQDLKEIDYPIMQTDVLYHLYYPKHACPSSPDAKRLQEQLEVETPSWRLKPLTNMYQLEGTENITDEAYYKRHQKFEQEEKRRKRWDLQRIRELRVCEKLERQKEEEMRASQDEADMETFLPSVQDLKHIEITESVPVMAFGQPLPYICPAEFEIPWDINSSAPSTSSGRHKATAGHSKRP
ncbi:male-specific lethal 1-like 1 [Elysia marginata]|uniref:Male-specific lethal 1-like 1 n=1 Tax=Elysia marginata TaxID=1093978 RepID=A0AAV4J480_9GAST|nr:male-specific lethal 1-like 1 [Elysia marginata]